MKLIAYTFAFAAEIIAWCALASVGFLVGKSQVLHWVLVVLIFAVVTMLWGLFMSPKAPHHLALLPYYLVKAMLYGGTIIILWRHGWRWAVAFTVILLLSEPFLVRDERGLSL